MGPSSTEADLQVADAACSAPLAAVSGQFPSRRQQTLANIPISASGLKAITLLLVCSSVRNAASQFSVLCCWLDKGGGGAKVTKN